MLIVIIFALLLAVGITWKWFDDYSDGAVLLLIMSITSLIIIFSVLVGNRIGFPVEVAIYKENLAYVESFEGLELSPTERAAVTEKIQTMNSDVAKARALVGNPLVNWFINEELAAMPRIDYDLEQSVLNIRIKE